MGDVLFEIREEQLETGLRGYPVGYCTTSTVDPVKGLFYAGLPVDELGHKEPEEVIYLLYYGKNGSKEEVLAFSKELQKRSRCKKETIQHIQKLPREGHPMKLFCAALLIAGIYEGRDDYKEDCLNLIAKAPEIVAAVINYHAGWGESNPSKPELGYIENFVQMLKVPGSDVAQLTEVFKLFNILHYDHGGGNLSTFIGKAVASGLEDMYGSMNAAMAALAGPRHGRANQDCLHFVEEILKEVGDFATQEQIEKLIHNRLEKGELIFGFGHAVLRVIDPRASVLYDYANKKFPDHSLVKMATLLKEAGTKVLSENPKISNPYPNVDAISGIVLTAAGFPYPEYYTILFGLSRLVGISIQIVYERCEARGGKGTPIVRPKYIFKKKETV
ncbi:MAG TPA: citrate (Si)-synthase [Parachlamydiaceae bacterium]|nr:citrate (Si)-synthase [Parachlamydiaceae bacterium]